MTRKAMLLMVVLSGAFASPECLAQREFECVRGKIVSEIKDGYHELSCQIKGKKVGFMQRYYSNGSVAMERLFIAPDKPWREFSFLRGGGRAGSDCMNTGKMEHCE